MTDQPPPFPFPPGFPDRAAFGAEWCAALRSGKWKQGKNQLRDGKRRCCNGVACDIAIGHGVGEWKGNSFVSPVGHAMLRILPGWLCEFLGRDNCGGLVAGQSLSALNDHGVPFPHHRRRDRGDGGVRRRDERDGGVLMRTRMDQYLRDYDYHLTRPTRRVAVSPRAPKELSRMQRVRRLVWWLTRWGR